MKKILILLLISSKCFSQNNFMEKNTFADTVKFFVVPYTTSTSVVHLVIDTNIASPTFGKLMRQTAGGGGYTTLSQFVGETNWTTGYINGSGDYTALALGSSGKVLTSNGASSAPTWETPTTGYTTLSQFVGETNWQVFYSNGSGDVTGLTVGAANTVLLGNGVTSAPTWGTVPNAALTNSTISGIALGSNLANLTATDATLTFSGTYTGATARTIGINLSNANTWAADQTVPDEAYDATNWNGNLEVPTKNAVRDKIETLGAGNVTKVGTPVNNQIGVWTGDGTLEGDTKLTFDGSGFVVTGSIQSTGVTFANALQVNEQGSPSTPSSGTGFVFFKTDSRPWSKSDDGNEYNLSTGGWVVLRVSGSNYTNATTSLTDITGLVSGNLAVATLYEFEANLYVNSSSTAGMQIALQQTGTGSGMIGVWAGDATNAAATGMAIGSNTLGTQGAACVLVNGDGSITIRGFVKTGSTGTPTIKLQALKTTSGTATVYIGSSFKYRLAAN